MEDLLESLFSMSVPWYEFLVRAIAVYVVVLVLVRIVGKRTVGQYTPFDLIVVVLLGTAVQNSLISDDTSLLGGLILAATLLAMNWLVGFSTARSKALDRVVEGQPVVLARHGRLFEKELRRQSITLRDLEIAMRAAGCVEISEVDLAMLETSGEISIIKC